MHTIPLLLAVIAALTIIAAYQAATAIRKDREHKKFREEAAGIVVALIVEAEKEMNRRVKRAVSTAIDVTMKALLPPRKTDQNDVLSTLLFGMPFSPTGRALHTNNRPTDRNDPFSIESLIAALGERPRFGRRDFGVGKDRFADLAKDAGRDPLAKDPGSADPLADTVRREFGVDHRDTGAASPLTETDPVELTTAGKVAGDGGVATEAEANAQTAATPLPPDYAREHYRDDHSPTGNGSRPRRHPPITVESADRPDNG